MILYDAGRAPNPRRVQIFLKEKGIDIERRQIDINAGEQHKEPFASINPMRLLPVLELDDGTIIAETLAICRYFEEIQPNPPLMGTDALSKAQVEMWQRRAELNFLLPVAQAFRHLHPGGKILEGEQVARWGEINQDRARKFMAFLNNELASRQFAAGDDFTVADITMLVAYQFLKPARMGYPEDLPNLQRWYGEVSSRPSAVWEG